MPAFSAVAVFGLLGQPAVCGATENDVGAWLVAVANGPLALAGETPDRGWRYWLEAQARYPDAGSGVNQLLFRPALGYVIDPDRSVYAGYARFRTHGRSGSTTTEDRLWQHLAWRFLKRGDESLSMRFRLEQRRPSGSDDTGLLFRYQLAYARSAGAGGRLRLFAQFEPFFDLRDTDYGARSGLNQVRLTVGVGWPLTAKTAMSAAYRNQYSIRPSRENTANHLAVLSLRTRF